MHSRELITLIDGLSEDDKKFIFKYVEKNSQKEIYYIHKMYIEDNEFINEIDCEIMVSEKLCFESKKTYSLYNNELDIIIENGYSEIMIYSKLEKLSDDTLFTMTEIILKQVNRKIKSLNEKQKIINDAINIEQDFKKTTFKKHFRTEKINNLTNKNKKL